MGIPIIAPIDERHAQVRPGFAEPRGFPVPPPPPMAARVKRWAGGLAVLASAYFLMSERAIALLPFLFVGGWLWLSGTAATHQSRGGWRDW